MRGRHNVPIRTGICPVEEETFVNGSNKRPYEILQTNTMLRPGIAYSHAHNIFTNAPKPSVKGINNVNTNGTIEQNETRIFKILRTMSEQWTSKTTIVNTRLELLWMGFTRNTHTNTMQTQFRFNTSCFLAGRRQKRRCVGSADVRSQGMCNVLF